MELTDYDWYLIINRQDFIDMDIPIYTFQKILEGPGLKEISVVRGNKISIIYETILLTSFMNDNNPFYFEDHAIFVDVEEDIYLGILIEE